MIPFEPTSSGTSWYDKDIPLMWSYISDIDLEPMYQQTSGWNKAIDLASTNLYRLKDFRDKLTTAWPPEKSEASQQYVTQLDGLIASVQDVYDAAVANKTSASNLSSSISEAQYKVKPLYDEYLANLQKQSDYDTALANKKQELSSKYGGTTNRSYIYSMQSWSRSNPNPSVAARQAEITQQARTSMSSLSTDLVVSSGKMVEPKPYQPPQLAGRDTDGSGGSSGGGGSNGGGSSSGGGGTGGSSHMPPIVPMPTYIPPPQPTLTGHTNFPTMPTPQPTAPITTLPTGPHPNGPIGMPAPVTPIGPGGMIKPPVTGQPGGLPGPAGRPGMGPVIGGPNPAGGRPGGPGMPGGRGVVGPNGVIGGAPGARGAGPGGMRGVNPAGGVVGQRPGAPGVAGRGGAGGTGAGGVAGRGGAGAAGGRGPGGAGGRGGAGGAGHPGVMGAGGRAGKRGQNDEHGHEWDPDNPWEVAEGVAPVVEAPGEVGPIDPGPAIGGRR